MAAFAPDEGETLQGIIEQGPDLSPGLLEFDQAGFVWFNRDGFVQYFAHGVNPVQARVLAAVQKPIAGSVFGEVFGQPAWELLPSWYLVAENDQIIPPPVQHFFAQRMGQPSQR